MKKFPCVLLILDGFGIKESPWFEKIKKSMPTFFKLQTEYASTTLLADGKSVGLPVGQVGNSEAGHQTIGAGRIILSDQVRINRAIDSHDFEKNQVLSEIKKHLKSTGGSLHLIGMLTNGQGSGHASAKHAKAILNWVEKSRIKNAYLHLITDGRDSSPYAAQTELSELKKFISKQVQIASISGRFYAMDRDRRWERSALAYEAYVSGTGLLAESAEKAICLAYARGETDEFISPTIISNIHHKRNIIKSGDAILFWNLRSDRSRQLLKLFSTDEKSTSKQQNQISTKYIPNLFLATLADFGKGISGTHPLYPHAELSETFVSACKDFRQLYLAESEKFAQITYFFNGGYDHIHFGEQRFITPSPKVDRYDHAPAMSLKKITKKIIDTLQRNEKDLLVANFANLDMVAHTGNEKATLLACREIDNAILQIWSELKRHEGTLVMTSDHGNVEELQTKDGGVDTQHNKNPVPFMLVAKDTKNIKMKKGGLADVAPTILHYLRVDKPKCMTGKNLLVSKNPQSK